MRKILGYVGGVICIIVKLTIIIDVLIILLSLILKVILYRKLSVAGVKPRWSKILNQSLSYRGYLKYWSIDYFREKSKVSDEIKKDFNEDFEKLSSLYKGSVFRVDTNKWVYENILSKLNDNYQVLDDEQTEKLQPQSLEKLILMNPITIYKNIFSTKFWKTIFRKECIHSYYIKV